MTALAFALRYWRVIAAVLSVVTLLGGAWAYVEKVKHDAYTSGYDKATELCEEAAREQAAANKKAADEAAAKLDDITKKLELKDIVLDDYIKAIDLAADQDPAADHCGLDVDSVRRLANVQ